MWDPPSTAASSTEPPPKTEPPAQAVSSSTSSSSEQQEVLPEASPWARRTARKTTSAKHAEHAQHKSLAPVEAAHWEPVDMEAGSVSSASMEASDTAQLLPKQEEVGATPKDDELSLDAVASALQQVSEAAPDPAGLPENPASPSGSETQAETTNSPTSPALAASSAQAAEAPLQEPPEAEVVVSTPPASSTETSKATSSSVPTGQDPALLEVECREGLRAQWLTFPFQPEECAAATLARCRTEASMGSLDTLAVWPDGGELDLTLTLEASLRPEERRLLATGPAIVPESAEAPRKRKPVTSEDGLYCLACQQRAQHGAHVGPLHDLGTRASC